MVGQTAAAFVKGEGFDKSGSCPNNPDGFGCTQHCKGHGVVTCKTCGGLVSEHESLGACQNYNPKLNREGVPDTVRGRRR
jgi:hypothetical protein